MALAGAFLWLALAALTVRPAEAQPVAGSAVMTTLSVTKAQAGETHVLIGFSQIIPQFSIVTNDIDRPVLGFADTSRGPGAAVPGGVHGLIKGIEFNQRDAVLVMVLVGVGPIHVVANPVAGGRALDLAITPAPAAENGAAASAGALPHETERAAGEDGFDVVPLKYADVSEVVGLLTAGQTVKSNDTFIPHEPNFGSAGMNGQQNYSAPPPNPDNENAPLGQSVDDSIAIDRRLNAVILKGSPERIARLKEKIAAIDVPVDSVILETQFVELDETGAKNVGFNFQNPAGQIGQVTLTSEGFSPPGFQSARGIISGSLQASLFAQVQKGHGRIVSKPRIAAQSGGDAKIITGDAIPILTSITLSGVNGVSQQVQYVNVGVTLQIAPRVSSDGFVTSHVFCVVSSVSGYSQNYPTISQREADTSVTVKDGEAFVIGGLTQDSDIVSKSKAPGVGDIPLLGEIFHLNNETKAKTELYIVVTPRVVRRGNPTASVAGN
jgi:general secretion pathway protein D